MMILSFDLSTENLSRTIQIGDNLRKTLRRMREYQEAHTEEVYPKWCIEDWSEPVRTATQGEQDHPWMKAFDEKWTTRTDMMPAGWKDTKMEEEQEETPVSAPLSGEVTRLGAPIETDAVDQDREEEIAERGKWNKRGFKRGWCRNQTTPGDSDDQDWAFVSNNQGWKEARHTAQQWGCDCSQSSNQAWYGQHRNREEPTQAWKGKGWYQDDQEPMCKKW